MAYRIQHLSHISPLKEYENNPKAHCMAGGLPRDFGNFLRGWDSQAELNLLIDRN